MRIPDSPPKAGNSASNGTYYEWDDSGIHDPFCVALDSALKCGGADLAADVAEAFIDRFTCNACFLSTLLYKKYPEVFEKLKDWYTVVYGTGEDNPCSSVYQYVLVKCRCSLHAPATVAYTDPESGHEMRVRSSTVQQIACSQNLHYVVRDGVGYVGKREDLPLHADQD